MSVARSRGSHAHTAHINQNEGAGYGTILQECISCNSWYACHIVFEICFIVLGWIMIFLKTKICTGFLWEMSWTLCHGRKQSWSSDSIAPAFVWELWHAAEGDQSIEFSESGFKTYDITGHNQELRPVRSKITYVLEEYTTCNFGVEVSQVEKVVYYVECRINLLVQRGQEYKQSEPCMMKEGRW